MRAAHTRTSAGAEPAAEAVHRKKRGEDTAPKADPAVAHAAAVASFTALGSLRAAQVSSMQRLQQTIGNQAVQALVQRTRPVPAAAGAPVVQRWHDDGHVKTTEDAVDAVGGDTLAAHFPKFANNSGGLKTRLGDASLNMDRFFPQVGQGPEKESHNVGRLPTLAAFATGMAWSQLKRITGQGRSRGLFGEGANHGEAGMYTQWSGAEANNLARENQFIDQAVQALGTGDYDTALNRLGDASHVAADRGSHGEGHKGRGHDTPMPPTGKTGYRFTPLTQAQTDNDYDYMESWEDNDDLGKNKDGYTYGLDKTTDMFQRFLGKAPDPEALAEKGAEHGAEEGIELTELH
jgi:hypothetical protein